MGFMDTIECFETDYYLIDGPCGIETVPREVVWGSYQQRAITSEPNRDPWLRLCTCGFSQSPTYSAHEHHASCELKRTDLRSVPAWLLPYCENRTMWNIEACHGWLARYTAPGYMDATEWVRADSREAAIVALKDAYPSDDEESEASE